MYSAVVDAGVGLIVQYGLVVLLVVFALEGALVGKLIPTRVLFVATVLAVGTDRVGMASVAFVAVLGATLGQFLLFTSVRHAGVGRDRLPAAGRADGGRVAGWFDRWGLSAVALSNTLPVARGALTVPAAMTEKSSLRFSASSMIGSSVYACGLLAVAAGLDLLVGLP